MGCRGGGANCGGAGAAERPWEAGRAAASPPTHTPSPTRQCASCQFLGNAPLRELLPRYLRGQPSLQGIKLGAASAGRTSNRQNVRGHGAGRGFSASNTPASPSCSSSSWSASAWVTPGTGPGATAPPRTQHGPLPCRPLCSDDCPKFESCLLRGTLTAKGCWNSEGSASPSRFLAPRREAGAAGRGAVVHARLTILQPMSESFRGPSECRGAQDALEPPPPTQKTGVMTWTFLNDKTLFKAQCLFK